MSLTWQWAKASRAYGNYGNANQWTVNAGMSSLARESTQNSNDARVGDAADLVYTFIRLTGARRQQFETAAQWDSLVKHLQAMAANSDGAVTAGQIKAGLDAMSSSAELVALQIADYGCRGLTGPEFRDVPTATYGNFIKLCRLDLFSGKDQAAGGSFGLGKAVYWRFSRVQTVLFNSSLRAEDAVGGKTQNRLFGVNAGVIHDFGDQSFQGRGNFGVPDGDDVASAWIDDEEARSLRVERTDTRPGTTALLLGFYDPDEPALGSSSGDNLIEAARKLRRGVEESFWPLLTRGRLTVRIKVVDDDDTIFDEVVDPSETYAELVRSLQKFDAGDIADDLEHPEAIVVRDIPIKVSARSDGVKDHGTFTHTAKLVVTLSDDQKDSLENTVCLLRQPEMVVQTLPREFESGTYHAFLLAGASISPASASDEEKLADDFLRFAEPPAHDRWIPNTGRNQASQANLTGRYVAPWVPNLKGIEKSIADALMGLFGAPPAAGPQGPESMLRLLRFLKGDVGTGGGAAAPRRPTLKVVDWGVEDGRWHVHFEVAARNVRDGWSIQPRLKFVGLDGKGQTVPWESLTVVSGATIDEDGWVVMPHEERRRKLVASIRAVSTDKLPIPAEEAAIDVVVGQVRSASSSAAEADAGTEEGGA